MLKHKREQTRQIGRRVVTAFCFSLLSASCGAEGTGKECSGTQIYGKCTITSGSHAGFEIGMAKQAAFENACRLATQQEIWDPIFYVDGVLQAHPGISMCELEFEALASDKWSFIESARLRERYIQLDFDNGKIMTIGLLPRGLDP